MDVSSLSLLVLPSATWLGTRTQTHTVLLTTEAQREH